MSQNLISIKESPESFYQIMTEKFCSNDFSIEILDAIFTYQKLTAQYASQVLTRASQNLINGVEVNETKLIELIKLLKKHLKLQDYCNSIILANPFNDGSFLHSISSRKLKQLTMFFLNEVNHLIDSDRINKQQIQKLFNANHSNTTAFLLICRMGDEEIYIQFIQVLLNAYANQLVNEQCLNDLLTKKDKLAFNPLHLLLNNGSVQSIEHFLMFSTVCHHHKVISSPEYALLLSAPTRDGYTPLHDAIKTNNPILVGHILGLNLSAVELGISTSDILNQLLTGICKGGFNPLQKIYLTKNMDIMTLYIQTMHDAVMKGFISNEILKKTFLHINQSNFSVYFDAVSTCDTNLVSNHIAVIRFLLKNAFIDIQDFRKQVLNPSNNGFNILFKAIKSKNPEILALVLEDLSNLLSSKEIQVMALSMMLKFGRDVKLDVLNQYPSISQQVKVFLEHHQAQDALRLMESHYQRANFFKPQIENKSQHFGPSPK